MHYIRYYILHVINYHILCFQTRSPMSRPSLGWLDLPNPVLRRSMGFGRLTSNLDPHCSSTSEAHPDFQAQHRLAGPPKPHAPPEHGVWQADFQHVSPSLFNFKGAS